MQWCAAAERTPDGAALRIKIEPLPLAKGILKEMAFSVDEQILKDADFVGNVVLS